MTNFKIGETVFYVNMDYFYNWRDIFTRAKLFENKKSQLILEIKVEKLDNEQNGNLWINKILKAEFAFKTQNEAKEFVIKEAKKNNFKYEKDMIETKARMHHSKNNFGSRGRFNLLDKKPNNTLSLDKSLCVASIGYLLGQLEKIYEFFFTAQQIEGVDKFLILFVGIAAATAIITGLQWYRGEDKLDEILTRIKSRTVVLNHNENDSQQ
jgi:hypothetical protein